MAVIGMTALALVAWIAGPASPVAAGLLIVAGGLQLVRLARWAGLKALGDPLVFVLHLSYAWLPAGLILLGCTMLHPVLPVSSAVHALGAGAMAAMTLAVMTRATRGHPGRRSEEHTSELPSLMRTSYAVFCSKQTQQTSTQ